MRGSFLRISTARHLKMIRMVAAETGWERTGFARRTTTGSRVQRRFILVQKMQNSHRSGSIRVRTDQARDPFLQGGYGAQSPAHQPKAIVAAIQSAPTLNLRYFLDTPKPIHLDQAQADTLVNALSQRVALIQGPPGMFTVCRLFIH